jgi:hypothetical protein
MDKPTSSTATAVPAPVGVRGYETDPGSGANPTGGTFITVPTPIPATPAPAIQLQQPPPGPPGIYPPGTPAFRYWDAAEAACRARTMWSTYAAPFTRWNPAVGAALPILLDQGVDLNAFYDRRALHFFHDTVAGRTVFSDESPDIVCHEEGHAVLDSVQPRLFTVSLTECAAFHEAFGDISAMLAALQLPQVRVDVLAETGGLLFRNSRLSRLAEQLGWAIRQIAPAAVDPDSLRNAANTFVYRDPATLPSSAPASSLSSEAHSFSRVFSSAFLLAMSNVFSTRPVKNEATLLTVATELGQLLTRGVRAAPVVSRYYAAVAAGMVTNAPAADHQAIRAAFVRKMILPPTFPMTAAAAAPLTAAIANVQPRQPVTLPGPNYSLDADVEVDGGDTPQGPRAAVAPMGVNAQHLNDPDPADAAHLFLTELLQHDRVVLPNDPQPTRNFAGRVKTHKLTKDGAKYRLERILFDCGLHS